MTIRAVACSFMMILSTISVPALAGDASQLNALGFSADGSIFAFEEYGRQDGSGFPFANCFYIDTASDSFVGPSPIRIRIDDESSEIADARQQAKAAGQAIVGDAELEANPGYLAGFNAITEQSADPHRMAVNPRPVFPPIDPPMEFRLVEIPFAASGACAGVLDTVIGFRLLSIDASPGGMTEILHEDTSVPSSRGCPTGYRIGGVRTFMPSGGTSALAVLISIEGYGFEGPDHRWMAVTRSPAN